MSKIEKAIEKAAKLRADSAPAIRKEPVMRREASYSDISISREHVKNEEKDAHLRDYLDVILRKKWTVIVFLITVVITGTLATFLMTPLYRATTTIQLKGGKTELVEFQDE